VLAFVAEFSRGKSELINAIFFAEAGRRVLPATPGRTTMCPVELYHDPRQPPRLSLLPIETRLRGLRCRNCASATRSWQHVPLETDSPEGLAAHCRPSRARSVSRRGRPRTGLLERRAARRQPAAGRPTARSRCRPGAMR
jgi:hypothetical protein